MPNASSTEGGPHKHPAQGYRPKRRTRLPQGGLLETRVRRDGRRASLVLDGLVLEVGCPALIARHYATLSSQHVK
jgi:hypothetical protein